MVPCSALYNYVLSSSATNAWQLASSVPPPSGELAFRSIAVGAVDGGPFTLFLVAAEAADGSDTSSRVWTYTPQSGSYALLTTSVTANTLWKSVCLAPYDAGANPSAQPTASFGPTPSMSFGYSQVT
jgi:hypothetical protein